MDPKEMFTEVVENVAKMCAVSAMTAPKSGGQLFLKGSKPFIETTIVKDQETLHRLAEWLRARGTKLKNPIFFRDADTTEKVDLILFIGLEKWYPPMYDCGACGDGTCNEFLRATPAHHTQESDDWEFLGPICQLRCVDLGIAVGSAAKLASMKQRGHPLSDPSCRRRKAPRNHSRGPNGRAFDERVPQEHFLRQEDSPSRFRSCPIFVSQFGRLEPLVSPRPPERWVSCELTPALMGGHLTFL